MEFYPQADLEASRREKRSRIRCTLLLMMPFAVLGAAAFAMRKEALSIAGFVLAGAILIFLYDLRIKPAASYVRFLEEVHSGLTHETLGTLVRVGEDPVYDEGVVFYEVILNIYEDMSVEGERRFLLDGKKTIPQEWIGRDVLVTSHGTSLLAMWPAEAKA